MLHKQRPECSLALLHLEEKNTALIVHWSKETETGGVNNLSVKPRPAKSVRDKPIPNQPKHIHKINVVLDHYVFCGLLCNMIMATVGQCRDERLTMMVILKMPESLD